MKREREGIDTSGAVEDPSSNHPPTRSRGCHSTPPTGQSITITFKGWGFRIILGAEIKAPLHFLSPTTGIVVITLQPVNWPSSWRADYNIYPVVVIHGDSDTNTMLECAKIKQDVTVDIHLSRRS